MKGVTLVVVLTLDVRIVSLSFCNNMLFHSQNRSGGVVTGKILIAVFCGLLITAAESVNVTNILTGNNGR
jgi:fucose permease